MSYLSKQFDKFLGSFSWGRKYLDWQAAVESERDWRGD